MFNLRIMVLLTRMETRLLNYLSFVPKSLKKRIAKRIAKNIITIDNELEMYNIRL